MKNWFIKIFKEMAETPQKQVKKLALGTSVSLIAMALLIFTSDWENQMAFYLLASIIIAGVIYAIPGYVGVWVWRMKSTLFREDHE